MLRKLFDRFRPKKHTDAVFGELLFMATGDHARSYWEGSGIFPATGDSVEFFIDALEEGPSHDQHQFYERLNQNWAAVVSGITPILERGWIDTGRPTVAGGPQFRLSSLSIPAKGDSDSDWELCFESPNDERQQLFSVQMRGWKPTGRIAIDG